VCFAPSSLKEDAVRTDTKPATPTVQHQPITANESTVVVVAIPGKPCPQRVEEDPRVPQAAPQTMKPSNPTAALPKSSGIGAVLELSPLLPLGPSKPEAKRADAEAVGTSSAKPTLEVRPVDAVSADPQTTSTNQKAVAEAEGPLWAALEEPAAVVAAGGGGRTRAGVKTEDAKQEEEDKETNSAAVAVG